jgi:signal transduction histidine kinase
MTNFLSNSLKFTKNGFIYIILRDFDDYSIEVEIIDNGSGINKNK